MAISGIAAQTQSLKASPMPNVSSLQPGEDSFKDVLNRAIQNQPNAKDKLLPILQKMSLGEVAGQIKPNDISKIVSQLVGSEEATSRKFKKDRDDHVLKQKIDIKQTNPQPFSEKNLIAQVLPEDIFQGQGQVFNEERAAPQVGGLLDAENVQSRRYQDALSVTPFQFFLDKSLDFLGRVTMAEMHSDSMMELYVRGKASIEELTIAKAKVSVALTFATTVVSQVTQTFKEIQNMQI